MLLRCCFLFCLFMVNQSVYAWGTVGHAIVADIAEASLNGNAQAQITSLLALEQLSHLDEVASWADHTPPRNPRTAFWHYVNTPLHQKKYDYHRDCHDHDCIIVKITDYARQLADKDVEPKQRLEALKWLVHFVGDIHQPLHAADNNDHGGNDVKLLYYGVDTNFHKMWDTDILEHALDVHHAPNADYFDIDHAMVKDLAAKLLAETTSDHKTLWLQNNSFTDITHVVENWALESHVLAVKTAYKYLPKQPDSKTGWEDAYQGKAWPVTKVRLQKAGLRLADLLNQIFS